METLPQTLTQTPQPPPEIFPASVEISRNSKGYTWTVKARGEDIDECLRRAKAADENLRQTYGNVAS